MIETPTRTAVRQGVWPRARPSYRRRKKPAIHAMAASPAQHESDIAARGRCVPGNMPGRAEKIIGSLRGHNLPRQPRCTSHATRSPCMPCVSAFRGKPGAAPRTPGHRALIAHPSRAGAPEGLRYRSSPGDHVRVNERPGNDTRPCRAVARKYHRARRRCGSLPRPRSFSRARRSCS